MYYEYHDLTPEETQEKIRNFLHPENNKKGMILYLILYLGRFLHLGRNEEGKKSDKRSIGFNLSPQSEYRNHNSDEPTSKGDLEEELSGP